MKSSKRIVANGWRYAEALVGGYLAVLHKAPIILANVNKISDNTIDYIKTKAGGVYLLGGEGVIGKGVFDKVKNTLGK